MARLTERGYAVLTPEVMDFLDRLDEDFAEVMDEDTWAELAEVWEEAGLIEYDDDEE